MRSLLERGSCSLVVYRLSSLWFLNAPFIFWGVWRMVGPFINPTTKSKIQFINTASDSTRLLQNVPSGVLPQCYGGDADLIPLEKTVSSDNLKTISLHPRSIDTKEQSGFARRLVWRRFAAVGDKLMERGWRIGHRIIRSALQNLGTQVRSGFTVLRKKILRQRVENHGQVPFRYVIISR